MKIERSGAVVSFEYPESEYPELFEHCRRLILEGKQFSVVHVTPGFSLLSTPETSSAMRRLVA